MAIDPPDTGAQAGRRPAYPHTGPNPEVERNEFERNEFEGAEWGPMPWQLHAACRRMPTELFFPVRDNLSTAAKVAYLSDVEQAKGTCERCPVRRTCLDHAIEYERYGIWGGTDEEQRHRMRRDRAGGAPEPRRAGGAA